MTPTLADKQKAALKQGGAYTDALALMKKADAHAEGEAGDYKITVLAEEAEGMYMLQPEGDLQWELPQEHENQHLEVVVQDKTDLRFIPYLVVEAVVLDSRGTVVTEDQLPFLWHPFLFHYGANIHLLEEGEFTVKITIQKPIFARHDQDKGSRYTQEATVTLGPITMTPGRKEYGPE